MHFTACSESTGTALILTAARSGEIRGSTWKEMDLDAGLWSIPGERMKMGRAHQVPLAEEVIETFRRAEAVRVLWLRRLERRGFGEG